MIKRTLSMKIYSACQFNMFSYPCSTWSLFTELYVFISDDNDEYGHLSDA